MLFLQNDEVLLEEPKINCGGLQLIVGVYN